jgi:FdhD protein
MSRAPTFDRPARRYSAEFISRLPAQLAQHQAIFDATGGLHGAGLFTPEGTLLLVREDVGRHNAVDKCIGARFLAEAWPLPECVLVVSGRAGFEIVDKALIARVQTVVSVSAPSSLAVELACAANMNLYGFVRGSSLNVYAGGLE